jgi:hypothetical protein
MKREQTAYIVLCTSDTDETKDIGLAELDLRDRKRGYLRCIYHFIVRRCGTIQHGHRKMDEPSMGLGNEYNPVSVSICVVGGKGDTPVTNAQLQALSQLIFELKEEYPKAIVVNHADLSKKANMVDLAAYFKPTTEGN